MQTIRQRAEATIKERAEWKRTSWSTASAMSPAQLDAARAASLKAGQILMNAEKARATAAIIYVSPLFLHCEEWDMYIPGLKYITTWVDIKIIIIILERNGVCVYREKKGERLELEAQF